MLARSYASCNCLRHTSEWSPQNLALLMHRQLANKHERNAAIRSRNRLSRRNFRGSSVAAQVCDVICRAACDAVLMLRVSRPRHHKAAPRPQQYLC
jgi:hypothetical protein